jgi:hypothetical protein
VHSSERESFAIASHRFARIFQAIPPDLQRTDLRDAVLDVVERVEEDVQLAIPSGHSLLIEQRPVHAALEPLPQPEPLRISCVCVASIPTGIDPGLEGIH